jgi:uncharacterized membrane protein
MLRLVPKVTPSMKHWLSTVFCTLGLGLSLHLALLKFFSLPCVGGGGCHSIIHSGYGAVFGIPVGAYGALLWAAAFLVGDQTKRSGLLFLLAVGSAIFLGIQFLVLRGFCLYCTAHAVCAFLAFSVASANPKRWALPLGIVLAFGGLGLARAQAAKHVNEVTAIATKGTPLATAPSGLPWLGNLTPGSPALVLSLDCAACLDLLEELSKQSFADLSSGPAIYFKVTPDNAELTRTFVAGVLATPGGKRDAFLASTALLLTLKDRALSSPSAAASQLAALLPGSATQLDHADKLLAAQTETLHAAKLGDVTPLLVPISAKPRAFFRTEELFPR